MSRREEPAWVQLESMLQGLESAGMRRAEIARQTGIDKSSIGRFAEGLIRKPSYEKFKRIEDLHSKVVLPHRR